MKHHLTILAAAALLTASCSGSGNSSDPVAKAASQCPIPVENVGFISSISLNSDTLTYVCNVTDRSINLEGLSRNTDAMKRTLMPVITSLFDSQPDLLDKLRSEKWTLSVRYVDPQGTSLRLAFSPDELSEQAAHAASATLDPEQRLADEIALSKSSLPASMTDAIVIDDICDRNGYVVFECSVDETAAGDGAMENLRDSAAEIRASMAESLSSEGDPDVDRLVDVTTAAGRGLAYRYTGTISGDTLTIAFSPAELRR